MPHITQLWPLLFSVLSQLVHMVTWIPDPLYNIISEIGRRATWICANDRTALSKTRGSELNIFTD
ncbi:hypothetical protein M758_1G017000 [Ceratodon purpureus]|uniref:Uncharacterized protein n=1 Tax=Ceratodon purpureus TaxID=3225 RepID=A0A8T0J2M1_CERPU|nr:hypothetical protein KC19_1G017600 [Ceratodon purpureus]KAG0628306.1 hypothetical protein M758_1G017000 [Ceratodon purpureus]